MGWSKLHCSLFAASLALGAGAIAPAWSATGHDSVGIASIPSIGGIVLAKHGADDPPGDDRGGVCGGVIGHARFMRGETARSVRRRPGNPAGATPGGWR